MRSAGVVDRLGALDELNGLLCRVVDGHDLVVLAVHDQRGHIDLFQVFGEVGFGEGLDALVGVLLAALHAPEPELVQDALRHLRARAVGAEERESEFLVEL
ncbi:hypothetical protein D3C85_1623600 [compost metagenome]